MPCSNTDLAERMSLTKILTSLASGHFLSSLIVKAELTVLPRELLGLFSKRGIVLKRDEGPFPLISPYDARLGGEEHKLFPDIKKPQDNVRLCHPYIFS